MQKLSSKVPTSWLRHGSPILVLLTTFGTYLSWLFLNMLRMTPAGLVAGHVHVWGDWSLHVGMANIFAYKPVGEWFAYHPYYADGKFTYGFLTNMISGLLVRTGIPYTWAFVIPSIFLVLALIVGMYLAQYHLTRQRWSAVTAVSLFFLSSGPGWWRWFQSWSLQPNRSWQTFLLPVKDPTRIESVQWLAGNFVNGMIIPQRAFLLGMTLACWSLAGLLWSLRRLELTKNKTPYLKIKLVLATSGFLAGVLPIAHMHSFIVLVVVAGLVCLTHWRLWKNWAWFVVVAGALSALLFKTFIAGGIVNPEFMKIALGWTAREQGVWGWLHLWWEIWGFFPIVMLAGVVLLRKAGKTLSAAWLGFTLVFILGNTVMMQPVEWDNSKLFLWVYFGWSSLVAVVLHRLWQQGILQKVVAVILVLNMTLSGVIELARLSQIEQNSVVMSDQEDLQIGEWVRTNTSTQARFATNTAHNHPVMMWGVRPILMGYPTWVWNFGFVFDETQADLKALYAGSSVTEPLIIKHRLEYVVVGPGERADLKANQAYFAQHFPVAFSTEHYTIYDVRSVFHN